jgi:hypothetical protein
LLLLKLSSADSRFPLELTFFHLCLSEKWMFAMLLHDERRQKWPEESEKMKNRDEITTAEQNVNRSIAIEQQQSRWTGLTSFCYDRSCFLQIFRNFSHQR